MPTQSISFEYSVLTWLKADAEKNGHNLSFMVNFYCQKAMNEKIKVKPKMMICPKHPEASYSSKLGSCPLCVEEETNKEIEDSDHIIISKRSELLAKKEELDKPIAEISMRMNAMEQDEPEYQQKQDSLIKKFDRLVEERKRINEEIGALARPNTAKTDRGAR